MALRAANGSIPPALRKYLNFMYKIRVLVREKRAHGKYTYWDYGRIIKNKDLTEELELQSGSNLPAPEYTYFQEGDLIEYYSPSSGIYRPVQDSIISEGGRQELVIAPLTSEDKEFMARAAQWIPQTYDSKKSLWSEIGPLAIIGVTGIIVLMIVYSAMTNFNSVIEPANLVAQSLKDASANMLQYANITQHSAPSLVNNSFVY